MSHEAISNAASKTTYVGSTLSVGSALAQGAIPPNVQERILGLTLNQWTVAGVIFGMVMALFGLLVNVYFKAQHLKLAEAKINEALPDGD